MTLLNLLAVLTRLSLYISPALGQAVKIIYDTDMDSDVDDVAATAILHALADRGEAEILATVISSANPWSAPCLNAINTFYGRSDLPIGVPKGEAVSRSSAYAQSIAETYPNTVTSSDSLPDAVQLYRQILATQPDSSVVNEVFENGTHEWRSSPNKDQCYVLPRAEFIPEVTAELNRLMTEPTTG
ncbi:hypothetical protein [Tunicatimonas pelagia]|uniref:hypothetical protein n=1 Tax=Tunicatimonas pelagia TaxID=931531 RepID=UPI002665CD94|nr:hypothetical protein [Tunicatimonas pelagia]WKN41021.1 hypothetical protein P0M28_18465 [Tunicatimonas pelagia]